MAQAPQQQPPQQQSSDLIQFEGFAGLNTQPSRYGIGDQECFVMDGFFSVGNDNARVIPDNGPAVFVQTGPGVTIAYFSFGNIGATPYCLLFESDGSIGVINTDTDAIEGIAPVGTIQNPAPGNIGVSQWGSKYILIVATQPNGYFIWDGTTFYQAGNTIPGLDGPGPIASSALQSGGSDYAVNDTGTVTGGINDATYIVNTVNATGNGTDYAANDTGTITTGDGNATYIINTVGGSGQVTGMHITSPGTNYLTANNVATATGGAQPGVGTGLTLDITVTSPPGPITGFTLALVGVVTGYTLTNPGTLYNNGANAATADGGAQPGSGSGLTLNLTVTSATMPTGISGSTIETYSSYVWIGNGPNLLWSGPGSVTDFSTTNGGGSLTSNDSSLRVKYVRLKQSNGYLYLFGDSSIAYVAGVQTTGSPPTTSFSLQNVDPEVGTPWPDTVYVLGSNIVFSNAWGAHVSFGGRAAKVSPELDGIYNTVPNFGGQTPSASKAILFGKRVWVLLLPVIDQITLQQVNKLFLWDEKRWCSAQQSAAVSFVAAQEINSVLTAWGSDGTSIYRLFQAPSAALTRTLRSKFWAPMSYAKIKAENRFWGLVHFYSGGATTITISIDSEFGASPKTIAIGPGDVTWLNNLGVTATWLNTAAATVTWNAGGDGTVVIPPNNCGQQGALVGITVSTNAPDIAILSIATMPVDVQYRG
jgi:hypothetical protein